MKVYKSSFSGGEISPEMVGKVQDSKYQSGVSTMLNFLATPQGPAENRPGLKYVAEVKDSTKKTLLIPFTYSTTQTMVLEIGEGYFRFHTEGSTLQVGSPAAYDAFTNYVVGDLVSLSGVNYYCVQDSIGQTPPSAAWWYPIPTSALEIPNDYLEADLFDLHYVQSADVLTIVHPNYPPAELRRLSSVNWSFIDIDFTPSVSAPTGVGSTASTGSKIDIASISIGNPANVTMVSDHFLLDGDSVYVNAGDMVEITTGFYIADNISGLAINLKPYDGGVLIDSTGFTPYTTGGSIQFANQVANIDNYYVVTAVGENEIDESVASSDTNVVNNLYVSGAFNTISWSSVSGATRYNIYKRQSGLYGYIGQTEDTSFIDDNIAPDMGITPPIHETVFDATDKYPGAVSYFEQRRVFGGTNDNLQDVWMTRSGTESDMSYSIPVKDSDRIKFRIAARQANTIRHVVPLTQLIILTSAGEWQINTVDANAITPTNISVKPQSEIGASNVQPSVVNNSLVYCTARGGHVRELGYSWESRGFITGDLSIRATHLFDNLTIDQMSYSKAPQPILWFISSNGKLLGFTYMPEQQIGAWHQHDTDGLFESCTVVSEGDEDFLYVVVNRTIGGVTKRYVERMESRQVSELKDYFMVDSGLTFDGTNTSATTMTLTGGTLWDKSEDLTCTSSTAEFAFPATTDVGDVVVLYDADGSPYRCKILSTSSTTVATVRLDRDLPVSLQGVATASWAFGRGTMNGLGHLEGKTLNILADGAVNTQQVVSSGSITLDHPSVLVHAGLPYTMDLETLPVAMMTEAFGQGRYKNVNNARIKINKSSGIFIGPDENRLIEYKQRTTEPYGTPPSLITGEIKVTLTANWASDGTILIRQTAPLPVSIIGLTLEISLGD